MALAHSHPTRRPLRCAILAVLLLDGSGCIEQPTRDISPQIHREQDIAVTQNQGRLRMRSLVHPMCGQIEEAADAIIAGTTNADVQLAALKWKMEAVPALREALFQPDWAAAASDTLVLCYQMTNYFQTGDGKKALGPASAQAVATCQRLREEFTQVLASATTSGDVSKVTAFAESWAAQHPIRASISSRPSMLTHVFERDVAEATSAGQAIAEVTTTLDDLNRKIDVYSDQLLRQARWEAELFKKGLLSDLRADQAVPLLQRAAASAEQAAASAEKAVASAEKAAAAVDRLSPSIERALGVVEQAPGLVASERETAIKALHDELLEMTRFIREERIAALAHLSNERDLILRDVHETISRERAQMTLEADQITAKGIDYAVSRVTRLLALAMAAAAVLGLLGLFAARWILFRRPP